MAIEMSRVQQFAQQENWAMLTQHLQQVLQSDPDDHPTSEQLSAALPFALRVLELGDFQDQWDVAKLLPQFGEGAIAPLIALLQNSQADPDARWFAARSLGDWPHPEAICALADVLSQTQDDDLSDIAATALANLGETAVATLATLAETEDTRLLAVRSLAQIRQSATIPALQVAASDAQSPIRLLAIEALSSFHHPSTAPILVQALDDPDPTVRQAAIAGLAVRNDLIDSLELIRRFSHALADSEQRVQHQAILALGRLGGTAAVAALEQALSATPALSSELQVACVRALGWIGDRPALEALFNQLTPLWNSQNPALAIEAVLALGRCPDANNQAWVAHRLAHEVIAPSFGKPFTAAPHSPNTDQFDLVDLDVDNLKIALTQVFGQLKQSSSVLGLGYLAQTASPRVRLHAMAAFKRLPPTVRTQDMSEIPLDHPASAEIAATLEEWSSET
jgi:HEAT repeat protein